MIAAHRRRFANIDLLAAGLKFGLDCPQMNPTKRVRILGRTQTGGPWRKIGKIIL